LKITKERTESAEEEEKKHHEELEKMKEKCI